MATLALGTDLTIAELQRREDPDGSMCELVDMISKENHILDYITWIECNDGTYHEDTRTVTEPSGQEREYDIGVANEAGVTKKVTEPTEMMASISEVDEKKYRSQRDPDAYRLQEDSFFLKGMTKTFVSRLFDANRSTNIMQINGINNRSDYNALSSDYTYDNAGGDASVTVNKTSVYLMQFGHKMVNCIYPRNNPAGGGTTPVKSKDFGLSVINQSDATAIRQRKYPAWQTWFSLDFGLFVHDPRCIKRIVNISTTNIDGVDDFSWHEDSMIDASGDLEYNGKGAVFMCNRTLFAQARKRANEKGNAFYTESKGEGPFAHPVTYWHGIPIVRVDQITNTQAQIQ